MALIDEKEYQFLLHLLDTYNKKEIHEFVTHSQIELDFTQTYGINNKVKHSLHLLVDPEIFRKYYSLVEHFKREIAAKYSEITGIYISGVKALPELSKFQILQNNIVPIVTPWEEINNAQGALIKNLRSAGSTTDLQNIGNSSRTLMLKLAAIVFNPEIHTVPPEINTSEGYFKNRLQAYIRNELKSHQFDELRKYIDSIVDTTNKAIDLMNKVTHDTRTDSLFAESCVIGVVTTVSLIKLVFNMAKA